MTTAREQAREAARAARPYEPGFYDTPSLPFLDADQSDKMADAASDVWEPLVEELLTALKKGIEADEDRYFAAIERAKEALA